MTKPVNFQGKTVGNSELLEGFFRVATISSDGQNLSIDFPEWLIPYFNEEILERTKACLEDAFYRVRPDLRKQ